MNDNKTGRYLKYAIGEIILVVIGILIALSINNWNENRKAQKIERQYLLALKEEFHNNKTKVVEVITNANNSFNGVSGIVENQTEDGANLSQDEMMTLTKQANQFPPKFIPSPGILNDLINSGYLSKISSQNLRKELDRWFVLSQEVSEEEDEMWTHRNDIIEYLQRNFSFRKILIHDGSDKYFFNGLEDKYKTKSYLDGLEDPYFDNLNLFYGVVLKSLKDDYYPELLDNIEDILEEIDRALGDDKN